MKRAKIREEDKMAQIWDSAFHYLDSCAAESQAQATMVITTSLRDGSPQSHELLKRLHQQGARVTRSGDVASATVTLEVAQKLLNNDTQRVSEPCQHCGTFGNHYCPNDVATS